MVERNMIREGFIRNTATSSSNPTFSGSQIVNEQQMTSLANGVIIDAAVTVSATENINITADLGARWKLDRLELYTDDVSIGNVEMSISDNDVQYFPITLTGSPNLYVGDILDSTTSGAPRYVKYKHTAGGSAINVFEWSAINDDSLVDFGNDGSQTAVEISDAPVGRPSDQIETLKLFNRFTKNGTAFVFIDNTGTDADEMFEIATATNGPWFGRNVTESLQPENTSWDSGTVESTRVVTSSGFFLNWIDVGTAAGWDSLSSMSFREITLDGARGYTSTTTTPQFFNSGDYTDGASSLQDISAGIGNILGPHVNNVLIDTDLYDRVRVRMRVSPLALNDIIEGPRLSWRWIDDADGADTFPAENSVLSQYPNNNFTGDIQDFVFDVSSTTTWSGAPFHMVRGLGIEPFTAVTGTGQSIDFFEVETYHSSGKDRVVLDRRAVSSGTRPILTSIFTSSDTGRGVTLPFNTRIKEPCIITKVMTVTSLPSANETGCFLARFNESDPSFNFPAGAEHFSVPF